jgi:predicted nucleotidyltransferase
LGFDEAFEGAWSFLQGDMEIQVVSIPMLVVLKIVAVMDREDVRHKKDGTDIAFILEHYLNVGNRSRLKGNGSDADLMQACGDDLDAATAQLLGRDMARAMLPRTQERIADYIRGQVEGRSRCQLVHGLMTSSRFSTFPAARGCLRNILTGIEENV